MYAYTPGSTPIPGDVFDGISGFGAESHPVSDLSDPRSDAYDALFAGTTVTPVDFDFGWSNALGNGGNRLTRVQLEATGVDRTIYSPAQPRRPTSPSSSSIRRRR